MDIRSKFHRYSGCGNTFLIADHRCPFYPIEDKKLTKTLCIEAQVDGIILLEESDRASFAMRTLNADGSEAEMCGNGLRCFGRFIDNMQLHPAKMSIETLAGVLQLEVFPDVVKAEMPLPHSFRWDIAVEGLSVHYLNTGVPHVVHFVEEIDNFDLVPFGKHLRYHQEFSPAGTNVNIAALGSPTRIRTYERGVEAETLACGTGATAVALAAAYHFEIPSPIQIQVQSGEKLVIEFQKIKNQFESITMTGSAAHCPLDCL